MAPISSQGWTLDELVAGDSNLKRATVVDSALATDELIQKVNTLLDAGLPVIVSGYDQRPGWGDDLFSLKRIRSKVRASTILVRNMDTGRDSKTEFPRWLEKIDKLNDFPDPEDHMRYYAKDIEASGLWMRWLNGSWSGSTSVLPTEFLPLGSDDLFSRLPKHAAPASLLYCVSVGYAYTSWYKEPSGSIGQNLMCHSAPNASAYWFMVASGDVDRASSYFHQQGHELDRDDPAPPFLLPEQLRDLPFKVYVCQQKRGDLVILPPRCSHQVIHHGGLSGSLAWSRMTVSSIAHALHLELPIYNRLARPEVYSVKLTLWYATLHEAALPAPNAYLLAELLDLLDQVIIAEWTPGVYALEPSAIFGEDFLTCDYCAADIFVSYFECAACGKGDGLALCPLCYASGRTCRCVTGMKPCVTEFFQKIVDKRNECARVLTGLGVRTPEMVKRRIEKSSVLKTFDAATTIHRRRRASELYMCRLGEGAHQVAAADAVAYADELTFGCFTHLHASSAIHSARAASMSADAIMLADPDGADISGNYLSVVVRKYRQPGCLDPCTTRTGWYDTVSAGSEEDDYAQERLAALILVDIRTIVDSARTACPQSLSDRHNHPNYQLCCIPRKIAGLTFEGVQFEVELSSDSPFGYGGSASIYKGRASGRPVGISSLEVAVKVFGQRLESEYEQISIRELRTASQVALRHDRILPFLGTAVVGRHKCLISPYMRNGNLLEYLKSHHGQQKKKLILQVAEAVNYLHTDMGLVHGDIKCANVLISSSGDAHLSDFGLSTFVERSTFDVTTVTTIREMGTIHFTAPELLLGILGEPDGRPRLKTLESDIYAFGMLILEAVTGLHPWPNRSAVAIVLQVCQGQHPSRPTSKALVTISHSWWDVCLHCWSFNPEARPCMDAILHALQHNNLDPCEEPSIRVSTLLTVRQARRLDGHIGGVYSVSYLPEGCRVASCSRDGIFRIWDTLTGRTVISFPSHYRATRCAALSPDGRQICSGGYDGTIRLWDTESGAPIGNPVAASDDMIDVVAFSPDGACIVSGGFYSALHLWGAATGEALGTLMQPYTQLRCVAFSPNGSCIASGSDDGTIRLWDSATRALLGSLEHNGSVACSVCFLPDGSRLISGHEDGTVRIWNVSIQSLEFSIQGHSKWVDSVAISPSGTYIASGSRDRTIRIWDARTGDPVGDPLTGHTDWVQSVTFSPDGRTLVSGSTDGTVRLWDLFDS